MRIIDGEPDVGDLIRALEESEREKDEMRIELHTLRCELDLLRATS